MKARRLTNRKQNNRVTDSFGPKPQKKRDADSEEWGWKCRELTICQAHSWVLGQETTLHF